MYLSTNGTTLYYIDVGQPSSPPIVLIHGFPLSHEMWTNQIEFLKNAYRVVAFDLRGQGRSEVGDGQFTLEFLVDDLIALLDHLKIRQAVLCGLSMGGYVSLRTVERNTERVSGLVLCDTKSEADPNETKLARGASIRAIKKNEVDAYAETFLKGALSPPFTKRSECSRIGSETHSAKSSSRPVWHVACTCWKDRYDLIPPQNRSSDAYPRR